MRRFRNKGYQRFTVAHELGHAILYSLCETAKLHGLDPRAYLTAATKSAIREPGAVTMPERLLERAAS